MAVRIVELSRKLVLTGTIIFFMPDSISQIAIALLASGIYLCLHLSMQAFVHEDDDFLQTCAMITATATLFLGLLCRAQDLDESASTGFGDVILGYTLVALQVGVMAVSVYCAVFIKLWPQLRSLRVRLKSVLKTVESQGLTRSKSKDGPSVLEQAARLQLEDGMAKKYGIKFKGDNTQDLKHVNRSLGQMSNAPEGIDTETETNPGKNKLMEGDTPRKDLHAYADVQRNLAALHTAAARYNHAVVVDEPPSAAVRFPGMPSLDKNKSPSETLRTPVRPVPSLMGTGDHAEEDQISSFLPLVAPPPPPPPPPAETSDLINDDIASTRRDEAALSDVRILQAADPLPIAAPVLNFMDELGSFAEAQYMEPVTGVPSMAVGDVGASAGMMPPPAAKDSGKYKVVN